jgi:hypothetical protein
MEDHAACFKQRFRLDVNKVLDLKIHENLPFAWQVLGTISKPSCPNTKKNVHCQTL